MKTLYHDGDIIAEKYQIITLLGAGGMGKTYSAINLETQQKVAIKVVSLLQATDWKVLELFEREAKVLSFLEHPAIPKYVDYFSINTEQDQCFYLVQELIEGESLANLIAKGWTPEETEIKDIASQILKILRYLQELNPPVIHRDIKPHNIIINQDKKAILVDFGSVQDVYRNTISYASTFVGTLGYMSLEQMRGQTNLASDLYSLGATLIFLITHKSPDSLPQKRMKIDFIKSAKIRLSDSFKTWLNHLIEPIIEDRFQSATEALRELKFDEQSQPIQEENQHLTNIGNHTIIQSPQKIVVYLRSFYRILFYRIPDRTIELKIDQQKFVIQYNRSFSEQTIIGETKDICLVQLETLQERNQKTQYYLVLWEGVKEHPLLIGNDQGEANFIISKINDFLFSYQLLRQDF